MTCRPLVVRHPDGTWQAWCPMHRGWESERHQAASWARAAAEQHQQQQEGDHQQ